MPGLRVADVRRRGLLRGARARAGVRRAGARGRGAGAGERGEPGLALLGRGDPAAAAAEACGLGAVAAGGAADGPLGGASAGPRHRGRTRHHPRAADQAPGLSSCLRSRPVSPNVVR